MPSLHAEAHIDTDTPAWYITRLCKHFAHKVDASFTDDIGEVHFPFGDCSLEAEPGHLAIYAEADDEEALERTQEVIERHLKQFAQGRETLSVTWAARPNSR